MSLFRRCLSNIFACKNQLPGLYISGTLVENGLIFECSVIAKQICQTTFSTQSYYRGSFRTLSNVWDGAKRRSLNVWKDSEYDSVLFFFFSHRIFVVVLCCIGILWYQCWKIYKVVSCLLIFKLSRHTSLLLLLLFTSLLSYGREAMRRWDRIHWGKRGFSLKVFFQSNLLFDHIGSIKLICEAIF